MQELEHLKFTDAQKQRMRVGDASIVRVKHARISLLSPWSFRIEFSATDTFHDDPSLAFWYRAPPSPPAFQSSKYHGGSGVCIKTEKLEIKYRGGPLTRKSLRVSVVGAPHKQPYAKWRYGDEAAWESSCKLEGAVRTLDHCNGRVDLESSLLSRSGWTIVDDSQSVLLGIDDAWVHTRAELDDARAKDLYVFHYGSEYQQMLDEFVRLSGRVPLLPRFALGNWYSRWWQYSQAEVTALVALFEHYRIPLSVMVLDMDWHVVERAADSSRGWTGYSWNTELFPEHRALLADLKRRGVRVTLNLHPADGVHSHELAYAAVAAKLHVDASAGEPVPFRCTDARFVESYLTDLHHPHERDGIEFWWIDWQQGRQSEMRGLDPLYWLNHVHSLDAERPNHPAATREHQRLRRVILSRWAGLGNHRYPLGFSGDTHTTWESLRFQPYLTQASANVCFGWWSHDIGGFGMDGCENEELYIRWVQFGLYSPILRLHSMKDVSVERKPWGWGLPALTAAGRAMRLRHALLPYLYTMAFEYHASNRALIRPMYHTHPTLELAYHLPQQYWFGSQLLVAPITEPADLATSMAKQIVWLPGPGHWFHFETGDYYDGGRCHSLYGDVYQVPVFAAAGAIVPMVNTGTIDVNLTNTANVKSRATSYAQPHEETEREPLALGLDNPRQLKLRVFAGADGHFRLYEDDGVSLYEEEAAITGECGCTRDIRWLWLDGGSRAELTLAPAQGDLSLVPAERTLEIEFFGVVPHAVAACSFQSTEGTTSADGERQPPTFRTWYDERVGVLVVSDLAVRSEQHLKVELSLSPEHRAASERSLMRIKPYAADVIGRVIRNNPAWPRRVRGFLFRELVSRVEVPNPDPSDLDIACKAIAGIQRDGRDSAESHSQTIMDLVSGSGIRVINGVLNKPLVIVYNPRQLDGVSYSIEPTVRTAAARISGAVPEIAFHLLDPTLSYTISFTRFENTQTIALDPVTKA